METKNYTYKEIDNEHTDIKINIDTKDVDWLNYSGIDISAGTYTTLTTNGTTNSNPWLITGSSFDLTGGQSMPSGKITLQGEGADLDINGVSLKDFMVRVEQRLAILTPDARLESEWEELRVLGDQYRKLEKEINDRMKTFDILKNE